MKLEPETASDKNKELWEALKDTLMGLGVKRGDILYIASDITSFMFILSTEYGIRGRQNINMALNCFVDVFQEVIGEEGTILFPVFSWDWCRDGRFDILHTKGEVGSLSNWVLENRKDFVRTGHPIYSFMVWGKDSDYLLKLNNQDAWSHTSPFYYMQTNHAKQLFFNIEAHQGMTFVHYIEQECDVWYRHPKYFFGEYIAADGVKETRMYSMYVRDVDVEQECTIQNQFLIDKGVAHQACWLDNVLTVVKLDESYDIIRRDIEENKGKNTLKFKDGDIDWSKERTIPYEIKGIKL